MRAELKTIFVDELGISPDQFTDDLSYGGIPEWDSASHMVLVVAMEEKFGIEFDPDAIVELTSVAAICSALKAHGIGGEADAG